MISPTLTMRCKRQLKSLGCEAASSLGSGISQQAAYATIERNGKMGNRKTPMFGKNTYVAPGAVIRGDVALGDNSSIWFNAVVRAEGSSAVIGRDTNIQDNCVLHVDEGAGLSIGDQVTIGHGAIIHGCTIKSNTLIGMGAIILNHAEIGSNCIIGAGALVTQNTVIPDGSLVIGNPGRVVRAVTDTEIENIRQNAAHYVKEAADYARA